jgi:hypothetical protein
MLIERGFSPADVLITVVRKPDGEGHAVLTLRTSEGDFVLDNLVDEVKHWREHALQLSQAPGIDQFRPVGHHRERLRRSGRRAQVSGSNPCHPFERSETSLLAAPGADALAMRGSR